MSSSPYTLHKKIDATTQTAQKALELAKDAHARLDVAPKVGPAGERGLKGDAGRDAVSIPGRDGKDAVGLSGAIGPQGIPGAAGRNGKDSPRAAEYDSLLLEVRKLIKESRTAIAAQDQKIKLLTDVISGTNQKTQ